MVPLPFVTLDVFTKTRFAGNPLAVVRVPKDATLTTEKMQMIAREFNLSETVILHEGEKGSGGLPEWRVRIFLTHSEVPFAGHPTIGTACYALGVLATNAPKGRLICNAGPIELEFGNGVARASIPHNVHVHQETRYSVEDVHRMQPSLKNLTPPSIEMISPVKGMNFVCVELPDLQALAGLSISPQAPNPKLDSGWTGFVGTYFYVLISRTALGEEPVRIRSRMLEVSFEDPATGSAACALTSFLAMQLKRRVTRFVVTQGVEMGRTSDIGVTVTLKENLATVENVELSGSAVTVMTGTIEID